MTTEELNRFNEGNRLKSIITSLNNDLKQVENLDALTKLTINIYVPHHPNGFNINIRTEVNSKFIKREIIGMIKHLISEYEFQFEKL